MQAQRAAGRTGCKLRPTAGLPVGPSDDTGENESAHACSAGHHNEEKVPLKATKGSSYRLMFAGRVQRGQLRRTPDRAENRTLYTKRVFDS